MACWFPACLPSPFPFPQGLSLLAAAFTLNPWELPAAVLDPLVQLIGDVVQGEQLCGQLAGLFSNALAAS